MDAPILRVVVQRTDMDCGVACLAMICGVLYENALCAVAQIQPDVCVKGLYQHQMIRAAKILGVTMRAQRRYDLENDTGILCVSTKKWKHDHLVVIKGGLIVDTDGTIWDSDVYMSANKAKLGSLLVVV